MCMMLLSLLVTIGHTHWVIQYLIRSNRIMSNTTELNIFTVSKKEVQAGRPTNCLCIKYGEKVAFFDLFQNKNGNGNMSNTISEKNLRYNTKSLSVLKDIIQDLTK